MNLILVDTKLSTDGGSRLFFNLIKLNKSRKEIIALTETNFGFKTNLFVRLCYSKYIRYLKNRYSLFCKIYLYLYYKKLLHLLVEFLIKKYINKPIKGIWCLSNDIVPILASILSKKINCNLHVSILDIPFTFSIHKLEAKLLKEKFNNWVTQAHSFDFASEDMKRHFDKHVLRKKKHIVLWSSAGVSNIIKKTNLIKKNIDTIVFCGSLRFFKEFDALSKAINIINSTRKHKVNVKIYSTKSLDLPNFHFYEYINDEDELIKEIRKCDLAYSPLSFRKKDKILVETSFPGKIATYLVAGLSILAHAPSNASNYKFVVDNKVGIGIDSIEPKDIAERILNYEKIWDVRKIHSNNSFDVLKKHFNINKRAGFFNTLFE